MLDPVSWSPRFDAPLPGALRLLDQTLLPEEVVYVELDDVEDIWDAIKRLVVRGAPAIGCAAALGLAAVCQHSRASSVESFIEEAQTAADRLACSRPTAVNLVWALRRSMAVLREAAAGGSPVPALQQRLLDEGLAILHEDQQLCASIGRHGVTAFADRRGLRVITHCNAGGLATSGYGTALAPIYTAHEAGLAPCVYADETRPLLQGSRLTAWELQRAGVDVTVICDNMAGALMRDREIGLVIVGADRIAANGDAANKIGTYGLAVLAEHHGIPFYVAAPYSTIDVSLADGGGIPIEQREADEIRHGFGRWTAPRQVPVWNPAFDVTPAALIAGIMTERGILHPPYTESIARFMATGGEG